MQTRPQPPTSAGASHCSLSSGPLRASGGLPHFLHPHVHPGRSSVPRTVTCFGARRAVCRAVGLTWLGRARRLSKQQTCPRRLLGRQRCRERPSAGCPDVHGPAALTRHALRAVPSAPRCSPLQTRSLRRGRGAQVRKVPTGTESGARCHVTVVDKTTAPQPLVTLDPNPPVTFHSSRMTSQVLVVLSSWASVSHLLQWGAARGRSVAVPSSGQRREGGKRPPTPRTASPTRKAAGTEALPRGVGTRSLRSQRGQATRAEGAGRAPWGAACRVTAVLSVPHSQQVCRGGGTCWAACSALVAVSSGGPSTGGGGQTGGCGLGPR